MKGIRNIYVIIADSSAIIRNGLVALLKRLPNFNVQSAEIVSTDALHHAMRSHDVDVLMINPTFLGGFDLGEFRELYPQSSVKIIAIMSSLLDEGLIKDYEAKVNLYSGVEELSKVFDKLMEVEEEDAESEPEALSQREKEIICYVVKGLTNKEIAENLFISVHTVITHRRNISRKLQIHSPAGLTIYAIVNKLVDIKEVKLQ